ncbi:MAG TPA: ATPase, T2SS/T4P/T4SS family [bacterium]|nr:ATPase, T2SS/T4P/T4SS family [bacterium]
MNESFDITDIADEARQRTEQAPTEPPLPGPSASGEPAGPPLHPLLQILDDVFHVPRNMLIAASAGLPPGPEAVSELRKMLVSQKIVTPEVFQQAAALLFELDFYPQLDDAELLGEFTQVVPIRYAKKFNCFPFAMNEDELWVAVEHPERLEPVQDVARRFKRRLKPVVSTHTAILSLINRAYDRNQRTTDQVIEDFDEADVPEGHYGWGIEEPEDLIDARDEEPIKRLLNNILYQAAKHNASDVHIDASPAEVNVRFRVDGVLLTATNLPIAVQRPLVNRIKIMSRLDISQHSLPQDGRTLILIAGRRIDIRVSTMPTVQGEKAVMRLLYQDQDLFDLRKLGLPQEVYSGLRTLITQTGGIILVAGPTGVGKTTTLYAALGEIDRYASNVMTIEDPVEYKIPGYVQTEVNPKAGLTFANALRSVLRQDPDVIMVGEMRDRETALIAIQAALTGHTVFSTVHTNDAASTVTRLVDMGIEPYLVSSTVMGVLAQRLVRKICTECKESEPAVPELLRELGLREEGVEEIEQIYRGVGCPACSGTGFRGRTGLFELMVTTEPIKRVLHTTNEANLIRDAAMKDGMKTMRHWGIQLIRDGITTVEEVLQATRQD